MMELPGRYFPPGRTESVPACLRRTHDGLLLEAEHQAPQLVRAASTQTSDNGSRLVTFDNGGRIELAPDAPLRSLGLEPSTRSRRWLQDERPMLFIITAFMFSLLFGFWLWGIPASAWLAAHLTPTHIAREMDERSLKSLDGVFFSASRLDPTRQEEIRRNFARIAKVAKLQVPTQVIFRKANSSAHDTFGLPGGTIIVSDDLVNFVASESELLGLLAHEVALLEKQLPLRKFYSAVGWITMSYILTRNHAEILQCAEDDANVTLHFAYSPTLRAEADIRAIDILVAIGENPAALADVYDRLSTTSEALLSGPVADEERRSAIRAYARQRAPR